MIKIIGTISLIRMIFIRLLSINPNDEKYRGGIRMIRMIVIEPLSI
jgi:hypothetical protein